jgi:uncharacterized protein YbjT (DUF2867 family)
VRPAYDGIVLLSSQDADADSPFCYAPVNADTEVRLAESCPEPVILRAGLHAEFFGRWVLDTARSGELALPMRESPQSFEAVLRRESAE